MAIPELTFIRITIESAIEFMRDAASWETNYGFRDELDQPGKRLVRNIQWRLLFTVVLQFV